MPSKRIEPLNDSPAVREMDEAVWALRLELPHDVWDDVRARWVAVRQVMGDDAAE